METIIQDLRFGFRMLARNPSFTVVAVIIMALGIGANTAIFSLVRAVMIRPLPFRDASRLVMVWEDASFIGFPRNTPAPGNYSDWKTQNSVFDGMAAMDPRSFNLTGDGEPEKVDAFGVTADFFPLLGVEPALGRVFFPDDDRPGANRVVVLSDKLWQSRYGGDANLIGRDVLLNGEKHTVVGVMPRGFQFLQKDVGLWVPAALRPEDLADRGDHYLQVIARMKPGIKLEQAQTDIKTIMATIAREHPEAQGLEAYVVPLGEELAGDSRQPLVLLLVAVGFVLLIASANLANLLLSRALGRSKEIAVRTALGARRSRLIRQLLTESIVLSGAGGAAGMIVAVWSFDFLRKLIPPGLTLLTDLRIDGPVLVFTLALSVVTGILFGLAPALQASRVDLNEALKQSGGRATLSSGHRKLQGAMVVSEVALAIVLLVGAGLLIKTFARLQDQYAMMRAESVLTVRTQLPDRKYAEPARRTAFYQQVLDRVQSLPGVLAAGYTTAVPLEWKGGTNGISIEGRAPEPGFTYDANHRQVSADYFKAIGIPLREGRYFSESDDEQSMPVAIINEAMARAFWPNEDAVGKRFKHGSRESRRPWLTIVGIVADVRQMGADVPVKAEMYMPFKQTTTQPWFAPRSLIIRASGEPAGLAAAVTARVHEVDPDQPVSNIRTMDAVLDEEVSQRRTGTTLLAVFAGLAVLLAALGIYGVLSYFVTQRTPEFGVRMALGARRADIIRLVLARGMGLALAGVAIGLGASFALTRLMSSLLFEVSATDPAIFIGIGLAVSAVSLASCYVPALRATRVDPMIALRYE